METDNSESMYVVTGNNQAYPLEIVSGKKMSALVYAIVVWKKK